MNPNDYLTTAEAAAAVGVSLREIQRKINAGILPATKRGGIWFIARDDLEAARASHERGPGRPAADATLRAIGVEVVDAADLPTSYRINAIVGEACRGPNHWVAQFCCPVSEFVKDNSDDPPEDMGAILALKVDESIEVNQGAGGLWRFTKVQLTPAGQRVRQQQAEVKEQE